MRDPLDEYLKQIQSAVFDCPNANVEQYAESAISDERANLHVRLRMNTGHLLEIREAVLLQEDCSLSILAYSYHFQDTNNNMVFRYDNSPHYANMETFPNHKHLPNAILASIKPTVQQVIQEAITSVC